MGSASQQQQQQKPPLLFSLDVLLNKAEGKCHFLADVGKQTSRRRVLVVKSRRAGRVDRGRRRVGRTGNSNLQIARRVRILKKLIPNPSRERESEKESGLDNLFRETADYILALQQRVKVMQVMVDALSPSSTGYAE